MIIREIEENNNKIIVNKNPFSIFVHTCLCVCVYVLFYHGGDFKKFVCFLACENFKYAHKKARTEPNKNK
jgi:hypothetical protein